MKDRTRKIQIIIILVGIVALLCLIYPNDMRAQEQAGWSAPYRLSSKEGAASEAFTVVDPYGYLHAFWIESDLPDSRSIIQYSRFDGENWSPSVDIYATQSGVLKGYGQIGYISPFFDHGLLHLVWTEGNTGPVYYSNAPSYDALSGHRWSPPLQIDIPAYQVKFLIDSKGIFHLIYSNFYGAEPGVYYLRSDNKGKIWTSPYKIDPGIPDGQRPEKLLFEIDDADGLHILWNYIRTTDQIGQAVLYAHSFDGGNNWSFPFTIDEPNQEESQKLRLSQPALAVSGQTIYVIWNGSTSLQRKFRFSGDAGREWSNPINFFANLQGAALGPGLALDGKRHLHYVAFGRYPGGIWHTYWDQDYGIWSQLSIPYYMGYEGDDLPNIIAAHHIRLAIRAGNQMIITFTSSPSNPDQALYAMHGNIDDVPPATAIPTPTTTATSTPTDPIPSATPLALVTPTPTSATFDTATVTSNDLSKPTRPLWFGLIPPVILITIVLAFFALRRR